MKTTNEQLTDWIINRIKQDFKGEVGLLIGEETYKLDSDVGRTAMSFFFPASEKANFLARTFIIDGIGYDLFPMSWERMERIAGLEEDNAPVILSARILYAEKEKDKSRFMEIQSILKKNLADVHYTYQKALEKTVIAMELHQNMLFEDTLYKSREASGHIIMYLSHAVAYTNQAFLKHGHISLISDLSSMKYIPQDYIKLIQAIVDAESIEGLRKQCYTLILNTRRYLEEMKAKDEKPARNQNFHNLAGWYHELSYYWREIYYYCETGETVKALIRSCYLQNELDIVSEEFGLGELDLLRSFDPHGLSSFHQRAKALEKQIRAIITEHGAAIDEYNSISDFLAKNG